MGYYIGTKIKCTKPELFFTGSTFNKEWKDFIVNFKNGVTEYYCRKDYLNEAIIELSRLHPEVIFTGVTWTDDYYNSIDFTYTVKDGELRVVKVEPHYQFLCPFIEDDEYKILEKKFIKHVRQYLERIDVIHVESYEDSVFDFLNDMTDQEGFQSYLTVTWENEDHKFTATKRYTSYVKVEYQRKTKNNLSEPDFDCLTVFEIQDEIAFGFYDCHNNLSEQERTKYPKYICYNDDSSFIYCNENSCEGCINGRNNKEDNKMYVLWKKYVQPIELNEY